MTAEMVQDIATTVDGKVQFTLLLDSRDDAELVRDVRQAVVTLDGVTDVKVNVRDPRQQAPTPARPGRSLPMAPEAAAAPQPPRVAAPTPSHCRTWAASLPSAPARVGWARAPSA